MKQIFLPEDKLFNLKKTTDVSPNLPSFIFKAIKSQRTSLGDNDAFPPEQETTFEYAVVKSRYKAVIRNIEKLGLESLDKSFLTNKLSKLLIEASRIEKPIRSQLEKLCLQVINKIFAIPEDTVNITCHLVDEVTPTHPYRMLPEEGDENSYNFEDVDDMELSNKAVLKRRLINSLIQGAVYHGERMTLLYDEEISDFDDRLMDIYYQILIISDYILFQFDEKINEKDPNQGAYVSVKLGREDNRTEIDSQALIFPYLLGETLRGLYELFSSHGLPSDKEKSNFIIKHADFLVAEPWDLRFGPTLWKLLMQDVHDTTLYPYVFCDICKLKTDDFNKIMKNIFAKTNKGKNYMIDLANSYKHDFEYNQFKKDLSYRNHEHSLITDGDYSKDDLKSMQISEDEDIVFTV